MNALTLATAELIVAEECARSGIGLAELHGKLKRRRQTDIRRRIARRLRDEQLLTWQEIGRLLGRNHASVLSLLGVHRTPVVRLTTCEVGALA